MSPSTRLVTIPFSHYCEKARWALDRAGVAYAEAPHLPLASAFFAWRAGGGRTVPVLVAPGQTLSDSTDILHFADAYTPEPRRLFPSHDAEVARWEAHFDKLLGPATRRWAYGFLLEERAFMRDMLRRSGPRWEGSAAALGFPVLRALMKRGMRIDAAGVARSAERIAQVFAEVEATLADGRRYLVGDRFTAADLTFAALAAPAVFPDGYARYVCDFAALPARFRDAVQPFRARPAGGFVARLYASREERA